jgi:hypothetical protein
MSDQGKRWRQWLQDVRRVTAQPYEVMRDLLDGWIKWQAFQRADRKNDKTAPQAIVVNATMTNANG